jgi:RNA polymerase sigma-70 factor (ECF subfamily)
MDERPAFISDVLPEHVRFVRAIARSLLLGENDADDVTQETLLRALQQPPEPGNLRGWLRVVARNFALRRKREERRRKRRELDQAPPGGITAPEDVAVRIEMQRRVLEAVRDLSEPYRSIVVHRYLDELSREQIAERLGIPLETVRTRLRRALRLLRDRLEKDDPSCATWIAGLAALGLARRPAGGAIGALHPSRPFPTKAVVGAAALGVGVLLVASHAPVPDASYAASAFAAPARSPADRGTPDPGAGASGVEGEALVARGLVVDASGRALPLARVSTSDGGGAVADGSGRFQVAASGADGRVDVVIRKEGYLPWQGVLDALAPTERRITLKRGAPLSVLVLGPGRAPVEGARVQATSREERGIAGLWWARQRAEIGRAETDASGRAEIGPTPDGMIEVRVEDPRYATWQREVLVLGSDPVSVESVLSVGGDVSGRVTDTAGRPIEGALVYSAAWPERSVRTRRDGSYDLPLVAEGDHRLLAEADGYGIGFFGASLGWDKPASVEVDLGDAARGIDIVLACAVNVAGRVVDGDGLPLPGVLVAGRIGPCSGRPVSVQTHGDGRFEIGPFAASDGCGIRLTLEHEGYRIDPVAADMPSEPGCVDLGDIRARRCGTIRGTVLDVDGQPLGRGRVEVGSAGPATLVRPDGTFLLEDVPPGSVWLQASAQAPLRKSAPLRVEMRSGASVSGAALRLRATRSILGHVVSSSGRPHAGVAVGALAGGEKTAARARTDAAGAFDLPDLPEGVYEVGILRVPAEEETTAPNKRLAFTEDALSVRLFVPGVGDPPDPHPGVLLPEPVARAAAGGDELTLVLPGRGTAVDGRVVSAADGLPVTSFEVSFIEYWHGLIPRRSETLDVRDKDGGFAYELGEGSWAAEIAAPGYAPYRTPVFDAGSRESWSLGAIRLGPGGELRGSVQDAFGDPAAYARLYLLGAGLQTNRRPIFTDTDGSFDAHAIAAGAYTVFVLSPRHPFGIVRNVVIREGEASVVAVRLQRPSPVTLVVKDQAGRPVPGADVSYTCDALLPLSSRLLRSYEPSGWGGHTTDDAGRLTKRFLPATRVTFRVSAAGYGVATRVAELREDSETTVEVQLEGRG